MVAATVEAPRVLANRLTIYDHAQMRSLLTEVRKLKLDDALECGALWVEYTALANGYPFFAVFVHDQLFGIVDMRGDLRKVQAALTAYLWHFGVRAEAITQIEYGARMPKARPTWRYIKNDLQPGEWVLDVWKHRDFPRLFEVE